MMPRVHIETFGCQMNESDSELVRAMLKREGFVFTEERDPMSIFAALLVHLVPVLMVVTALAIAWWVDACGGPLFFTAALLYALGNLAHLDWVVVISGPLLAIAILFVASWLWAARPNSGA